MTCDRHWIKQVVTHSLVHLNHICSDGWKQSDFCFLTFPLSNKLCNIESEILSFIHFFPLPCLRMGGGWGLGALEPGDDEILSVLLYLFIFLTPELWECAGLRAVI